jgi:hypothetical protein
MKKYEYLVHGLEANETEKTRAELTESLDNLGEQGWELISVSPITHTGGEISLFYFKRELPKAPRKVGGM